MATYFGPIPASQVKKESTRIFDALEQGRRVLISRYGKVVAAIDPASRQRHEHLLAAYAAPGFDTVRELTATEISQDGPAERIRDAENGSAALVTKNHKVYGLLQRFDDASGDGTGTDPDVQEQLLARFEKEHPHATPAEFAAEAERVSELMAEPSPARAPQSELRFDIIRPQVDVVFVDAEEDDTDLRSWLEAMAIRGYAHEQSGDLVAARNTFDLAIRRVRDTTDITLRRPLRQMMLRSALLHARDGDTKTALKLTEMVTAELDPASRRASTGPTARPARPAKPRHA